MILYLPKPTDGPVSRYINRRISGLITYLILKFNIPITPNQVSLISFLVGISASILYLTGNPIAGGVMVQLSSIIDGVDGELARVRGLHSRVGAFIDAVLDRIVDVTVIIALTLTTVRFSIWSVELVFLIGVLAVTGSLMVSYIHARGEASLGIHPLRIGFIPNISSRDVRLFIIFVGSVIGLYVETLITIAILSYTYISAKTIEVYVRVRRGDVRL